MPNPIYLVGAGALAVIAAVFVWSQTALISPLANTASASLASTPAMSPTEMMVNKALPIEQWDAF